MFCIWVIQKGPTSSSHEVNTAFMCLFLSAGYSRRTTASESFICLFSFFFFSPPPPDWQTCLMGWLRSFWRTNRGRPEIISLTPAPVRITVICWSVFSNRLRQVNAFPSQQAASERNRNSCCCQTEWDFILKIYKDGHNINVKRGCVLTFKTNHSLCGLWHQDKLQILQILRALTRFPCARTVALK